MKTLAIVGMLFLASLTFGQSVAGDTQFAAILPSFQGEVMQYSFPIAPFGPNWLPLGHSKKFSFAGKNLAQMETVNGVTMLYMSDSHDFCGVNGGPDGACSYLGTLVGPMEVKQTSLQSGATFEHVSGNFYGAFTDDKGNEFEDTLAILSFDTYPSVDGINVPSAGSVVIVLANN